MGLDAGLEAALGFQLLQHPGNVPSAGAHADAHAPGDNLVRVPGRQSGQDGPLGAGQPGFARVVREERFREAPRELKELGEQANEVGVPDDEPCPVVGVQLPCHHGHFVIEDEGAHGDVGEGAEFTAGFTDPLHSLAGWYMVPGADVVEGLPLHPCAQQVQVLLDALFLEVGVGAVAGPGNQHAFRGRAPVFNEYPLYLLRVLEHFNRGFRGHLPACLGEGGHQACQLAPFGADPGPQFQHLALIRINQFGQRHIRGDGGVHRAVRAFGEEQAAGAEFIHGPVDGARCVAQRVRCFSRGPTRMGDRVAVHLNRHLIQQISSYNCGAGDSRHGSGAHLMPQELPASGQGAVPPKLEPEESDMTA